MEAPGESFSLVPSSDFTLIGCYYFAAFKIPGLFLTADCGWVPQALSTALSRCLIDPIVSNFARGAHGVGANQLSLVSERRPRPAAAPL